MLDLVSRSSGSDVPGRQQVAAKILCTLLLKFTDCQLILAPFGPKRSCRELFREFYNAAFYERFQLSHLEWSARKVTTCSFVELTGLRTLFVIVRNSTLGGAISSSVLLSDLVGVDATFFGSGGRN